MSITEIVGRADVDPSSIDTVVTHLVSVGNQLLDEIGSIEVVARLDTTEHLTSDYIYTGVCQIVVGRFFDETFDTVALMAENSEWDRDSIRNYGHREVGLVVDMMGKHLFKAESGQQVRVHHQDMVVLEVVDECHRADSAEAFWLKDTFHGCALSRSLKVLFDFLVQIVDRDKNIVDTVADKSVDIVVDDSLTADLKQRLRGVESEWTQSFAFAAWPASPCGDFYMT